MSVDCDSVVRFGVGVFVSDGEDKLRRRRVKYLFRLCWVMYLYVF